MQTKNSRLDLALKIRTPTLRINNQHATLSAAQTGTDDGPASTSMYSELRQQRTGTGIFRWSVDEACGRTSRKNQRREKFCESSRRNPAEQQARALFGYFLPPWAKSINNASQAPESGGAAVKGVFWILFADPGKKYQ